MDNMDKNEFVNMVRSHQALINNVCYFYFPSEDDRKDARQEIILQLWKSISSFENQSKLSTWVYRIALNTVLNIIRKNKSSLKKQAAAMAKAQVSQDSCSFNDDIEYLKHLIGCLGEIDKAVILLYLEGYGHKEIAGIVSLSVTNVSSRLHRAKQYLRKLHNTQFYAVK